MNLEDEIKSNEKMISDKQNRVTLNHKNNIHCINLKRNSKEIQKKSYSYNNVINFSILVEKKNKKLNSKKIKNKKEMNINENMKVNKIIHIDQLQILSFKKNNSNMYENLYKEEKQRNNLLLEKEKEYKKKISSMLQEINSKDILIEQIRKELFKYEKIFNNNSNSDFENDLKKKIKTLEKKNKYLNSKIKFIDNNNLYDTCSTDEKHKFHIEKFYFNLLGINMNNQLSNLHKKVEELSEEKKNLSNSFYLKKLKYNDDLKKRDNKLNVYENQLSFLSNSCNNLIIKNGDLEKEKYNLEDIIFKQEDKITHLNNKLGEYNSIIKEKNKEMEESKCYLKKLIDKYTIIKNNSLKNNFNLKRKSIGNDLNNINNNSFNSFDIRKNYKNKINFPSIKLNFTRRNFIQLEKPSKNNNSDFKCSLFEANDIIEKKEKEGIKDIKEMIETLVDNI